MSDQLPGHSQAHALEARHVKKTFRQGPKEVRVLEDVNLELRAGKSLAIVGAAHPARARAHCCTYWEAWINPMRVRCLLKEHPCGR